MINCPVCGCETSVGNTYHSEGRVWRLRKCLDEKCGRLIRTVECAITTEEENVAFTQAAVAKNKKYQMGF